MNSVSLFPHGNIICEISNLRNNLMNQIFEYIKYKTALVKALQTELNRQFDAGLVVDGIYGNLTNNAIVNIQYGDQGNITRILQGLLICNG